MTFLLLALGGFRWERPYRGSIEVTGYAAHVRGPPCSETSRRRTRWVHGTDIEATFRCMAKLISLVVDSWGRVEGFTDEFIDKLFELVESSRNYDEELNYAVIRLIVSTW